MTAPARVLLSDLPKGHQLPATTFELTTADVERYLAAVEDANAIYLERGLAPPLAVAARALGTLLEVVELPDGTLHTGQEVELHAGVPIGSALTLRGRIEQRYERAGLILSVIAFEVTPRGSDVAAITGRTTVAIPAGAAGEAP